MLSSNIYRNDIDQVIRQFTTNNPANTTEQSYQNLGERTLTGIELEGHWQWMKNTNIFFAYTHVLKADDNFQGVTNDIDGIPKDTLNLGLTVQPPQLEGWSFGLSALARWNFVESDVEAVFPGAGNFTLSDYFIADLNIIKQNVLSVKGLDASLLIHNITDDTKNTVRNVTWSPRGFPRDCRQVLFGLRYQL